MRKPSRKEILRRDYDAIPLAEAGASESQTPKSTGKRIAGKLCKEHVWRTSKFSRQCSRCGLVELK